MVVNLVYHSNNPDCPPHTDGAGVLKMDDVRKNTNSVICKNIFKSDTIRIRKESFTRKMGELINGQEREQIYTKTISSKPTT